MSSGHRFFGNVSNCWLNSYGKFGGATRRRFFAICEKPEGGWYPPPPPPAVRGLTLKLYYSLGKLLFLKTCHENNPQGMYGRLCKHLWNIDWSFNPRSAGVWLVTRPARGGGPKPPPLRSHKLLDRFPNFKRHSIALYVNYPYKVKNLTRRSLMMSQVRSKSEFSTFRAWWHRRVKFRC